MFPKWAKAETKIANFMKDLDPTKKYTRKEMNEYCKEKGINDLHHFTNAGKTKYGMIIKIIKDQYYLYPELVEDFNKNFNHTE